VIERLIIRLGAPGVGALIALETVVPPIPSEVVLPFAGFQAARGHLNPVTAWVAATIGSLIGAWLLYGLGAAVGRDRLAALAAKRWFIVVGTRDLERGERFFVRHGGAIVLIGRCIPLVRSVVSIPAGLERMSVARFGLFTAIGSGIWNAAFITAGWHLEERWKELERLVQPVALTVLTLLVIAFATTAVRKIRASKHRSRRDLR
jgi:membrane protein DedA with SNARE-associated domain